MPILKFTAADVLRGKILETGWYGLTCKGVSDWKKSTGGDSVNCIVTFVVDNSEGKELEYLINSKGMGFHVPIASAMEGVKINPEDISIDTDKWPGKKVDGKVIVDMYEGRPNNKIADFLSYGAGKNQPAPF